MTWAQYAENELSDSLGPTSLCCGITSASCRTLTGQAGQLWWRTTNRSQRWVGRLGDTVFSVCDEQVWTLVRSYSGSCQTLSNRSAHRVSSL